MKTVKIIWPNNHASTCNPGDDWLKVANEANIEIPTGCLGGSCGACELEANGDVIRACIDRIPDQSEIKVDFFTDPYW